MTSEDCTIPTTSIVFAPTMSYNHKGEQQQNS
jgi:hypothetical protein